VEKRDMKKEDKKEKKNEKEKKKEKKKTEQKIEKKEKSMSSYRYVKTSGTLFRNSSTKTILKLSNFQQLQGTAFRYRTVTVATC
jgi:hypothetical protein